MNHTLAIARRELAEKRFVFTAAFALACVIAVLPFLSHVGHGNWREFYVVGSMILSLGFAAGVSVILGVSIIGRELSDRRLSFYFTKPVSAPAIWFGKLLASAVLVGVTFAIANVPALVAGSKEIKSVWSNMTQGIAVFAIIFTTFFFVAHVLSTIARSRSAWALLDLVAATALGIACWWIAQPLFAHFAFNMLLFVAAILGWLLLIIVIAAGTWQLTMGRTDRVQSHRALSQFLWPAVAVAVAICGAIVLWVVSATPSDLNGQYQVHTSPRGDLAFISGAADHRRDYRPVFLMNLQNGAYERLRALPLQQGFTPDGTKIVTIEPVGHTKSIGEVMIRDAALHAPARETGLILPLNTFVSLSPDGQRIAYIAQTVLTIYDVPSKHSLGSVRLPKPVRTFWFVSPDVLRIFTATQSTRVEEPHELSIFEYDIRSRSLTNTGSFQRPSHYLAFTASSDGSRLFLRNESTPGVTVLDGRTAAVLMTIPDVWWFRSLPDGRMVGRVDRALRIYSAAGVPERDIPIGSERFGFYPLTMNHVLVETKAPDGWVLLVVDINSGSILRRDSQLLPIDNEWFLYDGRHPRPAVDRIFMDRRMNLVSWNPVTNQRKVLVAKKR